MVRPECGDGEVIPGTLLSRTLTTHSQTWGVVGDNLDTDYYLFSVVLWLIILIQIIIYFLWCCG